MWTIKPSVSANIQHDDNLLLVAAPHKGVTWLSLAPHVDFTAAQSNWQLTGSGEWRARRYSGQSSLNGNDQVYGLSSQYQGERSVWQLGGSYAKEAVMASSTFSPDIGLSTAETTRITRSVNPSWTWLMSERSKLELNYQSGLVSYESQLSQLVNYTTREGTATYLYQWTPRDQLAVLLDRSYFKTPQVTTSQLGHTAFYSDINGVFSLEPNPQELSNISTTDSLTLGWTHTFSQTLNAAVSVGPSRTAADTIIQTCAGSTSPQIYFVGGTIVGAATCTQTTNTDYPRSSSGYLFNVGLNKKFLLTQVNLSAARQVTPSGTGTQAVVNSVTLGITHQISPRLTAVLSLSSYQMRSLDNTAASYTDRNYASGSANLAWKWTRQLTVQGGYLYIRQRFLSGDTAERDNAIFLKLAYGWQGFSISR